jgi:hypothetical protein
MGKSKPSYGIHKKKSKYHYTIDQVLDDILLLFSEEVSHQREKECKSSIVYPVIEVDISAQEYQTKKDQ